MRERGIIAVYIVASGRNGTLYMGVTSDLAQRAWEHRTGAVQGFASRYGCTRLVQFEAHEEMAAAIAREKSLKRYLRNWKLALIEEANPTWRDLYDEL